MIEEYFQEIIAVLASRIYAESIHLIRYDLLEIGEEKILIYRIRITLSDGGLLEMMERVLESDMGYCKTTTYSFHWQDRNGSLVRRWDNAPHHPELDSFPYHIHVEREANVVSGECLNALGVIAEVDEYFQNL